MMLDLVEWAPAWPLWLNWPMGPLRAFLLCIGVGQVVLTLAVGSPFCDTSPYR